MIDFIKKHILHTKTLTIVAGLVALGAFIAAGYIIFSMPQEAEAATCRTVDVTDNTFRSSASASLPDGWRDRREDQEQHNGSITVSDYVSSDEYLDEVHFTLKTSASFSGYNYEARSAAEMMGSYVVADTSNDNLGETQSFVRDGSGVSTVSWNTSAYVMVGEGSSAYSSGWIDSAELIICEIPNEPPVAVGDGQKGATYNIQTAFQVLGNDYDPDNGPQAIHVENAWNSLGDGSWASPTSDNSKVVYDPGSLSPGSSDTVTYRISDGEDTDTATFDVEIGNEASWVKVNAPSGTTYTPVWNGTSLASGDGDQRYDGLNLSTSPKIFEVPESSINVASGYTYSNMSKSVPVGNKTGNQYAAELGLDYTEYSPEASASFPSNTTHGQTVTFDASGSTDSDGSINSYSWSFGDNVTGSGQTYSRSFSICSGCSAQSYSVQLTVKDNDGHTDTTNGSISVNSQDYDGDGVYDRSDSCTYDYGNGLDGCPIDSDNDGVYDHDDSCPLNYGNGPDGCAIDSDGDGVLDHSDSCPYTWGSGYDGCPVDDGGGTIKEPKQFETQL